MPPRRVRASTSSSPRMSPSRPGANSPMHSNRVRINHPRRMRPSKADTRPPRHTPPLKALAPPLRAHMALPSLNRAMAPRHPHTSSTARLRSRHTARHLPLRINTARTSPRPRLRASMAPLLRRDSTAPPRPSTVLPRSSSSGAVHRLKDLQAVPRSDTRSLSSSPARRRPS